LEILERRLERIWIAQRRKAAEQSRIGFEQKVAKMTKKDWSKRQDRHDREGKAKMVPESPDCDPLQSGLFEFHADDFFFEGGGDAVFGKVNGCDADSQ
jgi:hypothetical protein